MNWPAPTHDSVKSRMERATHPTYSCCLRCGRPWNKVKPHTTNYNHNSGCFPLCKGCWTILGCPEARIEYYATLIGHWNKKSPVSDDTKREIQKAVANGG